MPNGLSGTTYSAGVSTSLQPDPLPFEFRGSVAYAHCDAYEGGNPTDGKCQYGEEIVTNKVYEFLTIAAPLKIRGATGSPLSDYWRLCE